MKRKHKRLSFVVVALGLLGVSVGLMLTAFEDNIVFFYSPTDLQTKELKPQQRVRIGGLVEDGSVDKKGAIVNFNITDMANNVPVSYEGILPDLFREGQGVVAEGTIVAGVFQADEVLAKHDETYMPPEVAEALKRSGKFDELSDEMKRQAHEASKDVEPVKASSGGY